MIDDMEISDADKRDCRSKKRQSLCVHGCAETGPLPQMRISLLIPGGDSSRLRMKREGSCRRKLQKEAGSFRKGEF